MDSSASVFDLAKAIAGREPVGRMAVCACRWPVVVPYDHEGPAVCDSCQEAPLVGLRWETED
jgi:hypothetical protein